MKKKFFTREVKVGVMAVIAIFILYFGLNFLKGINLFSPINYYYAIYDNIDGLVPSSPVLVKGFKVGQVENIKYDFTTDKSFVVEISVNKDVKIPQGAKIELFDNGLMGGKAVQLVYEPYSSTRNMYKPGDTIESQIGGGLMAKLSGDLMPKIESISTQADSLLRAVRILVESKEINNSLISIERTTADLAVTSTQLKKIMNNDFPRILGDVNILTADFRKITGNLKEIDYAATFASIDHTIKNLNLITDKINHTEGTIGMLLNDKSLYLNLSNTASSADNLLIDLKKNPGRYVNFSLIGRKVK